LVTMKARLYFSLGVSFLCLAANAYISSAGGAVVINEIMYNPSPEQGNDEYYEYIELHNTASAVANIGGWKLRDGDPTHEPFVMPANTKIEANGYLVVCSNFSFIYYTYGISNAIGNFSGRFGLGNDGETIILWDASDNVVDQVTYNDAYPWPFQPDADGPSLERVNPLAPSDDPHNWAASVPAGDHGTPGKRNSLFSDGTAPRVVINEIHYHPASNSDDDEYVELYNSTASEVSLVGWEFTNGISFTFPPNSTIAPFGHLVVCKNQDWLRANYDIQNVAGNFVGSLDNNGETIVLRDQTGRLVNFVAYSDERYWPVAADGYGPSLECINPILPNSDPANWASSFFARRWVHVQSDPASPTGDVLYFYLNGEGEVLLDDVALVPEAGGQNLIPSGDFENGDADLAKCGNHSTSTIIHTAAHSGSACMKIISTGDGGGGEWRNYVGISLPGISFPGSYLGVQPEPSTASRTVPSQGRSAALAGQRYVLSFWARPLKGETRLTARVANSRSTNGIYAAIDLAEEGFASTPGSQNTASLQNLPPFIYRVRHSPEAPTPKDSTTITARVVDYDPGSSVSVSLEYNTRGEWIPLLMYDDGQHGDGQAADGEFGALILRQPSYSIVRYRVVAQDDRGAVTVSPDADDMKPSFAYFSCDQLSSAGPPFYFLFVSDENLLRLEQLGSRDDYVPATFIYAGHVYDDVGVRWYGSFSERIASRKKSWRIKLNGWEEMDGLDSLILLGGDYDDASLRGGACLREMLTQLVFKYAGCAYSETQHVQLYLNGSFYGLMLRVERPDTAYLERNLRDSSGDLFQAQSLPGQPPSNMSVLPSYDDYVFAYDRKTNRLESHDRLVNLIEDLNSKPENEIRDFFYQNLKVDKYGSYLAAVAMTQNWVSPSRDYYLFYGRDLSASQETYLWELMPWGGEHNWERPSLPVLNGIVGENEYSLPDMMRTRFFAVPELRGQFANRLQQLLDTTYTEAHLFSVIDLARARIESTANRDRDYWWPEADSLAEHVAALKNNVSARRAFLYSWLDGIEGPAQPVNVAPPCGAHYVSDPIVLVGSEFSGIAGTFHESSQWQVRASDGLYSTPVWESGEDPANKTSITLPPGLLPGDEKFFWRVRYKDDRGMWSLWSDETSFTTDLDTTPPSVLFAHARVDVPDEVVVCFSEPVDTASAETLSNYVLNDGDSPEAASLSADGFTVTLKVSPGLPLFSVTVSNVSDRATSPNVIQPDTTVPIQAWSSSETRINFQPDSEPLPPGYLKDAGAAFDQGRGYGWTTDIRNLAVVRKLQTDPRLDTLLQFGGEGSAWELALPSGAKYRVTVCIGDAASESVYNLAIEGRFVTVGLYLPANEFREVTTEVDVADGHLTLYGGSIYKGTRIAYIHVLSSASAFRVASTAVNASNSQWVNITWNYSPSRDYTIHWSDDLLSWNAVTPDPGDMVIDEQHGTATWIDKGTSPGMGGLPPGQARRRFYKVELLTQ